MIVRCMPIRTSAGSETPRNRKESLHMCKKVNQGTNSTDVHTEKTCIALFHCCAIHTSSPASVSGLSHSLATSDCTRINDTS